MGKIIGVMSLKGGVGKTSVVSSLGHSLADIGKKVLLIDGNFSAPNLGIHFNIIDPEKTLKDVLARKANVSEAIYALGNLDILPSGVFDNQRVPPLRLKEKIRHLKKKYDVILIDSPPSLEEEGLATLYAADEIFFVTTPDHSTLADTIKTINRVNERGTMINGIILNKVHKKGFELSLREIEDTTNVPVMAVIPFDLAVKKAQSLFKSLIEHKPNSVVNKEFKKLAGSLIGEKVNTGFDWKKLLGITPKRQEINRERLYERVFKE